MVHSLLTEWFGIPPTSAIYLVSILLGYPAGYLFTKSFQKPSTSFFHRHLFMALSGLLIGWFCFGNQLVYLLFSSFITFNSLKLLSWIQNIHIQLVGSMCVIIFNFFYLMILYYYFQSSDYDIDFTTAQAVMCLRYIAVTMDFFDGQKILLTNDENKKKELKIKYPYAITTKFMPSLIEFFGFSYSFYGFLVGPIIPFVDYVDFVSRNEGQLALFLTRNTKTIKSEDQVNSFYNRRGFYLFGLALCFLFAHQIGNILFPWKFFSSDTYNSYSLYIKMVILFIYPKLVLAKYFGVWLIIESIGTFSQYVISETSVHIPKSRGTKKHEPKKKSDDDLTKETEIDESDFPKCQLINIIPFQFQLSGDIRSTIASFNINTNSWGKYYLYKRFAFLGSKQISAAMTLIVLCIWHGFHFGYYHTFFMEYVFMMIDDKLISIYLSKQNSVVNFVYDNRLGKIIRTILYQMEMYFMFIAFDVLQVGKFWLLIKSSYGIHHLFLLFLFIIVSIEETRVHRKSLKIIKTN